MELFSEVSKDFLIITFNDISSVSILLVIWESNIDHDIFLEILSKLLHFYSFPPLSVNNLFAP